MTFVRISRAKFENISFLTLNIVNMMMFILITTATIMKAKYGRMTDIIQAIYCTTMCIFFLLHEFTSPAWTHLYFGFLNVHRGKGILMLLSLGCLVMCDIAFNIIVSILSFTIGFTYFLLSLVPTIPPPSSFLIHWQNHKDFWAEGLDLLPTQHMITNIQYPHPSAWRPSSFTTMAQLTGSSSLKQDKHMVY